MELDDLILAVQDGDARAWTKLGRQLALELYPFFRSRVGETDADDLLQHTLLVIHRKLAKFEVRTGEPFLNWVWAIARVQVLEAFRQEARQRRLMVGFANVQQDPGRTLDSWLERDASLGVVRQELTQLSSQYRRVIESDLRDSEPGSLAERENIKSGTVRSRRYRAHRKLRRRVRSRYGLSRDTPNQA